jgi:hypothetical protein
MAAVQFQLLIYLITYMTKRVLITLLQILLISGVLFITYYFYYLKPKIQLSKNRTKLIKFDATQNTLTK